MTRSRRFRLSRADAYAAFYRATRFRLVHAVYAFCGDTEVAQRAVADAFVSAGHHWRKVAALAADDREAWVRDRAMRYAQRRHRGLQPWYVRARKTDDRHRTLLAALRSLPVTDRRLVLARYLVGRDLPAAARETGVTVDAAQRSLDRTADRLAEVGIDATPGGLAAALESLRHDVVDEVAARPHRLRREGNRRRRSHMGLVALCSIASVIGAGALTAAQTRPVVVPDARAPAPAPAPRTPTATPAPPQAPEPRLTTASLTPVSTVTTLPSPAKWRLQSTSADFGRSRPYDACLPAVPHDQRATHFFTRTFTSGNGQSPRTAVQAVEMSRSLAAADRSYRRLVTTFATCAAPNSTVADYRAVRGIGDAATVITLRYLDHGAVAERKVGLAHTGLTVTTWVVDTGASEPVPARGMVRVLAASVQRMCGASLGRCARRPFTAVPQAPPRDGGPPGFLSTLDMPLFPGLTRPWVPTAPRRVSTNPAATDCDRADFARAGAHDVRSRTYVVPDAPGLDPIFGMTQTRGEFASPRAAEAFLETVAASVAGCHDRQISLEVTSGGPVRVPEGSAQQWRIALVASEDQAVTFQVALFRVGSAVGQLTFTPTDRYDLTGEQYADLVRRAAQRLEQG